MTGTTKEKWTKGISTCVEALTLASQLLDTARQKAKTVSNSAEQIAHDLRTDAAARARDLGNAAAERLRPKTPASTRAVQFLAGVGVGMAAGVLFTPSAGKEYRERLVRFARQVGGGSPQE